MPLFLYLPFSATADKDAIPIIAVFDRVKWLTFFYYWNHRIQSHDSKSDERFKNSYKNSNNSAFKLGKSTE